ncbi:MAG: multicopper oxidase domain-containing protein [Methylobacteriaceae bacterium]|nr:multicopper oxidase domain-containing protein [Methylobacteriaceae bacterium]
MIVPPSIDRRSLLVGAAAAAIAPRAGQAQPAPLLTVGTRVLDVKGRAATVFGVAGRGGRPGVYAAEGERFDGLVTNGTPDPLIMHWHGQTMAPAEQDRSRPGGGALGVGMADHHAFALTRGTHWMHSHQLSEQQLLAAPMIAREREADEAQDIVLMLHDFAFRPPAEILRELGGSDAHAGHGASAPAAGAAPAAGGHAAMGHGQTGHGPMGHGPGAGRGMVHANDVRYDAYLANDRTLDDPEVVRVEPGARVRLRIINGATATVFFIDPGALPATCAAVDGVACQPHRAARYPLAQGQRIDLTMTIPREGGAFPILAQVEAERMRTGLVLATAGAQLRRIADMAPAPAPHADLSLDLALRPRQAPPARNDGRMVHLMLGEAAGYRWTINGAIHGEHQPIQARLGERVLFMFMNPTSMMHPMHLHGHHFQVVSIGGRAFPGPLRDTVIVPPHMPVVVAVDFDKPGAWYLHCHHLDHLATGMMSEVVVA